MIAEVCLTTGDREHVRLVSVRRGDIVSKINCIECNGTGWWAYGPEEEEPGPCVPCKGAGQVMVGLM